MCRQTVCNTNTVTSISSLLNHENDNINNDNTKYENNLQTSLYFETYPIISNNPVNRNENNSDHYNNTSSSLTSSASSISSSSKEQGHPTVTSNDYPAASSTESSTIPLYSDSNSHSESETSDMLSSSSPSSSLSLSTPLLHPSSSLSPKIKITSLPPISNEKNSNEKQFAPSMKDLLKHTTNHTNYLKSTCVSYEENFDENYYRYRRPMRSLHTNLDSILSSASLTANDRICTSTSTNMFDGLENLAQVALEQQRLHETRNKNMILPTRQGIFTGERNENQNENESNIKRSMETMISNLRKQNVSRKCKVYDCIKSVASKGLCASHGGGKRCSFIDCERIAVSRGLCRRHGGGKRCDVPTCMKGTQSNSNYCWAHGGGKRCEVPYCMSSTKTYGLCAAHLRLLYVKYQPELVDIMNRNVKQQRVRGGCIK